MEKIKKYNLDDVLELSPSEVVNLYNKHLTDEIYIEMIHSDLSKCIKLSEIDLNILTLIYILDCNSLFEFDGQYYKYIFENTDEFCQQYVNYIDDPFGRLYLLYKQLWILNKSNTPINHVLIHTRYEVALTDMEFFENEEEFKQFINDESLVSITNEFIKDKGKHEFITTELATFLTSWHCKEDRKLSYAKQFGIIYNIDSINQAFEKCLKLMELDYCGCFTEVNLYTITYLPYTRTLVLEYDCESG